MADGWSCGSAVARSETASGCWYEPVPGGAARCYSRVENLPGARELAWGASLGTTPQEGLRWVVVRLGQHSNFKPSHVSNI